MLFALVLAHPAQAQDAAVLVKKMSDYLGSQKNFSFAMNTSIEAVTPQGEKIQFNSSGEISISRPNKFRGHRAGGYADVELVDDGKTLSFFSVDHKSYAQIESPATIDQTVDMLRNKYMAEMPAADLILADSFSALMEDVIEAKHIGQGVVDGVECEHLAFRATDTDWQLWIELGDKPVPRKLVITSKTVGQSPQFSIEIKNWKTDVSSFGPDTFTFNPPSGAQKLDMTKMPHLDEVPESTPLGGGKP
jgi:hypothetical protein